MAIDRWLAVLLLVLGLFGSTPGARALDPTCGNDAIEFGEECDGSSDVGCPHRCSPGCTCPPAVTMDIPSEAVAPNTPGSPDVDVSNAKLLAHLGADVDLNRARYTRFQLDDSGAQPDAILILIPGFLGGANNFRILAQHLLTRAQVDHGLRLEVWGFDRRTNQLEDTAGLEIAESALDVILGGNWLFGDELSLPLDPRLDRRAVFYNTQDDVPFLANWTNLVFSRDIDAVVEAALAVARNGNVFLGGHSAGTGFTARYAATDFNITPTCAGTPEPGYAKVKGLVLLEGGGGSTSDTDAVTEETLDRVIARFDGGLFGAVRDNAPRCVDGTTPCTIPTEATDCAGQAPPRCTPPTSSYASIPGVLNPRVLAAAEANSIQSVLDLNTGRNVGQLDLGMEGNNPIAKVPDLAALSIIPPATVAAAFGTFLNKNGDIAQALTFLAVSVGQPGPVVDGILTWTDINGALDPGPDLGPPPTMLPAGHWGVDKEVTRIDRVIWSFFAGETNFTDWYYPAAGPSTTTGLTLDTTTLSAPPPVGRGRCDIENLTQAANIDVPVIAFAGSAGVTPVPGSFTAFAQSIGVCTAGSCDGSARVIDAANPNPAFPTFGDVDGGFEVYVNEGFAHLDVLTAEDTVDNHVVGPLAAFLARNSLITIPCPGDCNATGVVDIGELVRGVNIALGTGSVDDCPSLDCNETGEVTIDCLLRAVGAALNGCPIP